MRTSTEALVSLFECFWTSDPGSRDLPSGAKPLVHKGEEQGRSPWLPLTVSLHHSNLPIRTHDSHHAKLMLRHQQELLSSRWCCSHRFLIRGKPTKHSSPSPSLRPNSSCTYDLGGLRWTRRGATAAGAAGLKARPPPTWLF